MITHLLSRRTFIVGCLITRAAAAFGFTSIAQKTVDKRNSSEIGEYAVGFALKASDGGFDHAFIVWYYSDPNGQRTVRRCAGFYPVSDSSTKSYDMILGVSGKVFDDSKVKISQEITVLVNKEAFDRAIAIENQYKNDDISSRIRRLRDLRPKCCRFHSWPQHSQPGGTHLPIRLRFGPI